MPQPIDADLLEIILNLEAKFPRKTRVENRVTIEGEPVMVGLKYVPEQPPADKTPLLFSYYGTDKFTSAEEAFAAFKSEVDKVDIPDGVHLVIRRMPVRSSQSNFEYDQVEYGIGCRFHVFGAKPEPKK